MRSRTVLILSALLMAATGAAAEPPRESPRDKALMIYFSKSFGGTKRHAAAPLAFGLRLQQSSPFDAGRAVTLVDARHWLGGPRTLAFGGVPVFSLGGEDEEGSTSQGSSAASNSLGEMHPGWTAAMIVAAVLGGMCLAEWGICKGNSRPSTDTSDPPGPTPGTG
jgi:hypothetical protein